MKTFLTRKNSSLVVVGNIHPETDVNNPSTSFLRIVSICLHTVVIILVMLGTPSHMIGNYITIWIFGQYHIGYIYIWEILLVYTIIY